MTQARRTRKVSTTNQKPIKHGLREILFIFFCFVGLYVFVSLLTYDPIDLIRSGDPGVVEDVKNKGGIAGLIFADILFNLFGYIAYLFPIMIGYLGWFIYQGKYYDILAEPKSLIIPTIGFALTLIAGCGLAIVHFSAEGALLPSYAGGLLGVVIGKNLESIFSQLGSTLLLIALFFTGVTLLTGLSWLKVMDILGFHTLRLLPVVEKYFAQRFLPWSLSYLKHAFDFIKLVLASLMKLLQKVLIALWDMIQTWREDWQERRNQKRAGYYQEDEYEDDDYFDTDDEPVTPSFSHAQTATAKVENIDETEVKVTPVWHHDGDSALPPLSLLSASSSKKPLLTEAEVTSLVHQALQQLQLDAEIITIYIGPVLLGIELSPNTALDNAQLDELNANLLTIFKVKHAKIIKTQANTIGIELPNPHRQTIYLHELLQTHDYRDNLSPLTLAIGKEMNGKPVIVDLNRIPNVLIAGSYIQEKTIALHSFLLSILFKSVAETVKFILVDSHDYKLSYYNNLPHLLTPVIFKPEATLQALQWCVHEMEQRYRIIAKMGVRNIEGYNQAVLTAGTQETVENPPSQPLTTLPYIVVVISEVADLMHTELADTTEELISQLAQKARSAGIHLVIATQFPSANVITSLMKSNIPTRVAFQVTSKTESRLILGQMGAETLLGEGDMLYMTAGTGVPVRMHGCHVTDNEVQRVTSYLKKLGKPDYISFKIPEDNHADS